MLALVVALNFAYQVGPGHSDYLDQQGPAGQAELLAEHHIGDGDVGHPGHLGGVHCAGHCGGHSAAGASLTDAAATTITYASIIYAMPPERILRGQPPQPLTKPPSA